jgi:hypothetical protein
MKPDSGIVVRKSNNQVEEGILSLGGVSIEIASARGWDNRSRCG